MSSGSSGAKSAKRWCSSETAYAAALNPKRQTLNPEPQPPTSDPKPPTQVLKLDSMLPQNYSNHLTFKGMGGRALGLKGRSLATNKVAMTSYCKYTVALTLENVRKVTPRRAHGRYPLCESCQGQGGACGAGGGAEAGRPALWGGARSRRGDARWSVLN